MFDNSKIIEINKGSNINEINDNLFIDNNLFKKNIYLLVLNFSNTFFVKIHYGEFIIKENSTFYDILRIISATSNVNKKITIVEGWNKLQLNNYLLKKFDVVFDIDYDEILAETYQLKSKNSLEYLHKHMINYKNNFFDKHKDNIIFKSYNAKEIMIIGSLIEKEAKDDYDKKLISSVIFNRLKKNMRLQIDATVIYALTDGNYIFDRNLTYEDLKIQHEYNTYYVYGLPPKPISYVGRKTINIIFENYKSNYLFYFYNKYKNLHIYSKTFIEHKEKLNEYRKK